MPTQQIRNRSAGVCHSLALNFVRSRDVWLMRLLHAHGHRGRQTISRGLSSCITHTNDTTHTQSFIHSHAALFVARIIAVIEWLLHSTLNTMFKFSANEVYCINVTISKWGTELKHITTNNYLKKRRRNFCKSVFSSWYHIGPKRYLQ